MKKILILFILLLTSFSVFSEVKLQKIPSDSFVNGRYKVPLKRNNKDKEGDLYIYHEKDKNLISVEVLKDGLKVISDEKIEICDFVDSKKVLIVEGSNIKFTGELKAKGLFISRKKFKSERSKDVEFNTKLIEIDGPMAIEMDFVAFRGKPEIHAGATQIIAEDNVSIFAKKAWFETLQIKSSRVMLSQINSKDLIHVVNYDSLTVSGQLGASNGIIFVANPQNPKAKYSCGMPFKLPIEIVTPGVFIHQGNTIEIDNSAIYSDGTVVYQFSQGVKSSPNIQANYVAIDLKSSYGFLPNVEAMRGLQVVYRDIEAQAIYGSYRFPGPRLRSDYVAQLMDELYKTRDFEKIKKLNYRKIESSQAIFLGQRRLTNHALIENGFSLTFQASTFVNNGTIRNRDYYSSKVSPVTIAASDIQLGGVVSIASDLNISSPSHPFFSRLVLGGNVNLEHVLQTHSFGTVDIGEDSDSVVKLKGGGDIATTDLGLNGDVDIQELFQAIVKGNLTSKGNTSVRKADIKVKRTLKKKAGSHLKVETGSLDVGGIQGKGRLSLGSEKSDNPSQLRVNGKYSQEGHDTFSNCLISAENFEGFPSSITSLENVIMEIDKSILFKGRTLVRGVLSATAETVVFDGEGDESFQHRGGEYLKAKMPIPGTEYEIGELKVNARNVHFEGLTEVENLIVSANTIGINGKIRGTSGENHNQILLASDIMNINGAISSLGLITLVNPSNTKEGLIEVKNRRGISITGTVSSQENVAIYAQNLNLKKSGKVNGKNIFAHVDNQFFAKGKIKAKGDFHLDKKYLGNSFNLNNVEAGGWVSLSGEYNEDELAGLLLDERHSNNLNIFTTKPIVIQYSVKSEKKLKVNCANYIQKEGTKVTAASFGVHSLQNIVLENEATINAFSGDAALTASHGVVYFDGASQLEAEGDVYIKAAEGVVQRGYRQDNKVKNSKIKSQKGDLSIKTDGKYESVGGEVIAKKGTVLVKAKNGVVIIPIYWMTQTSETQKGLFTRTTTVETSEHEKRSKLEGKKVIIDSGSSSILENTDIKGKKELSRNISESERQLFHDVQRFKELTSLGSYAVTSIKVGIAAALSSAFPGAGTYFSVFVSSLVTDALVSKQLGQKFNFEKSAKNAAIAQALSVASDVVADKLAQGFKLPSESAKTPYVQSLSRSIVSDTAYGLKDGHLKVSDVLKNAVYVAAFTAVDEGLLGDKSKAERFDLTNEYGRLAAATAASVTQQMVENQTVRSKNLREAVYGQFAQDLGFNIGQKVGESSRQLMETIELYSKEVDPEKREILKRRVAAELEKVSEQVELLQEMEKANAELVELEEKESKLGEMTKAEARKFEEAKQVVIDRIETYDHALRFLGMDVDPQNEKFLDEMLGDKAPKVPFAKEATPEGKGLMEDLLSQELPKQPDAEYVGNELGKKILIETFNKVVADSPEMVAKLGQRAVFSAILKVGAAAIPGLNLVLCFRGETKVCLDDSDEMEIRAIRDLKQGDEVLSHEITIGEDILDSILSEIESEPIVSEKEIYKLVVADPDDLNNQEEVYTTDNHPFLDEDYQWKMAGDLAAGDFIFGRGSKKYEIVESYATGEFDEVYDISVCQNHNFAVTRFGLIVHNCGAGLYGAGVAAKEYFDQEFKKDKALFEKVRNGEGLVQTEVDRVTHLTSTVVETLIESSLAAGARGIYNNKLGVKSAAAKKTSAKKGTSSAAGNVNAKEALTSKLRGLEKAQKTANSTKTLPDGRIRYYSKEVPAKKSGPTRGASYVTEHDPKTGQVKSWMESYDHNGNVIRVHPKSLDGNTLNAQHYPPTGKELGK